MHLAHRMQAFCLEDQPSTTTPSPVSIVRETEAADTKVFDPMILLSKSELAALVAAEKLTASQGTFTLEEWAAALQLKGVAAYSCVLRNCGLIEYESKNQWRTTTAAERKLGVSLSAREKDVLKQLEVIWKRHGYITSTLIEEKLHVTNVSWLKTMKVLAFAGYLAKDYSKKKTGEWKLLRYLDGTPTTSQIKAANPKIAGHPPEEPYKRDDGVWVCPTKPAQGYNTRNLSLGED